MAERTVCPAVASPPAEQAAALEASYAALQHQNGHPASSNGVHTAAAARGDQAPPDLKRQASERLEAALAQESSEWPCSAVCRCAGRRVC